MRLATDLKPVLYSLQAVLLAMALGLTLALLSGGDPLAVLAALFHGAVGTRVNLAGTLVKTVPLSLTGLSVALAFRAGLFNIGGEGQLYVGALAAAWLGSLGLRIPAVLCVPLVLGAAAAAGAMWGAIPGWLRARYGVHEVINTIMMNHIAIQATDYLVNGPLRAADTAARTRDIVPQAMLPVLWETPPIELSWGILLAMAACACAAWVLFRTAWGYEIRAVGCGPVAAGAAGISVGRVLVGTMALGGGLAGLAGGLEICGVHHTLYAQFSPGYGFDGIAVALLARNHPLGVIPAALFFGALRTADRWLQLSAGVPRDLVVIIQAAAIFVVGTQGAFARLHARRAQSR